VVKSFLFSPTPSIICGIGKRKELPQLIKKFGKSVLVITGSGSFSKSELGHQLLNEIQNVIGICHFASVSGEPTPEIVDETVARFNHIRFDVVIAIGGGSVLDAGKAISAMLGKSDSVIEFLEGVGTRNPDGSKVPFIAVPTTAGTGSETTKNAVISRVGENGFKKSLRHDNYIPNIALVDPELTISCSKETTAASGLDAFTQLIEAYVSTKSSPFIDALAFDGLMHVIKHLRNAWEDGSNLEARSGMSYAAMLSGIALANAGLGTVHGFASSVGGMFPIPHGVVCGTLMAECAAFTIERLQKSTEAYLKFAKIGKLVSPDNSKSDEYYCSSLISFLRQLTDEMRISSLSKYGVTREVIPQLAAITENKNNPVTFSTKELSYILEKRL
jgi:alcohol dehydrogenase class IV